MPSRIIRESTTEDSSLNMQLIKSFEMPNLSEVIQETGFADKTSLQRIKALETKQMPVLAIIFDTKKALMNQESLTEAFFV